MSEEKVMNAQVGMLIEQSKELAGAVKDIANGVSTLLQFQASQSAHNEANQEWKRGVESDQDKQDLRIDDVERSANLRIDKVIEDHKAWVKEEFQPVRDSSRANSLIVNAAVGSLGVIIGVGCTILTIVYKG